MHILSKCFVHVTKRGSEAFLLHLFCKILMKLAHPTQIYWKWTVMWHVSSANQLWYTLQYSLYFLLMFIVFLILYWFFGCCKVYKNAKRKNFVMQPRGVSSLRKLRSVQHVMHRPLSKTHPLATVIFLIPYPSHYAWQVELYPRYSSSCYNLSQAMSTRTFRSG